MLIFFIAYRIKDFKNLKNNLWLFLFFVSLIISTVFSKNIDISKDLVYDYFKLLLFYYIVINTVNNEKYLKLFILSFFIISYIYVILSLREFFFYGQHVYDMGVTRLIGWDKSTGPNRYAITIASSLPFARVVANMKLFDELDFVKKSIAGSNKIRLIYFLLLKRLTLSEKILKLISLSYLLISILSIILTQSRTGFVCLLVFLFSNVIRTRKKFLMISFILISSLISFQFISEQGKERIFVAFDAIDNSYEGNSPKTESSFVSAQGRLIGLRKGFEIFLQNPLNRYRAWCISDCFGHEFANTQPNRSNIFRNWFVRANFFLRVYYSYLK